MRHINRIQVPLFLLLVPIVFGACGQTKLGACEDCELMLQGMPASPSWSTKLSTTEDPGEPLFISGTVFMPDGKTPAPGIILYVYHTDQKGKYTPSSGQTNGRRHGHLRGWMKTDDQGRYQFTTIRPGSYPNRTDPQHIHMIIKEANSRYYWLDDYLFEDDPLLTASSRGHQENRGGSGILSLKKNDQGIWIAKRDIVLGLNIPNYNP